MSNHIALKFFALVYSPIPKGTFAEKIPQLKEELRKQFPRFDTPNVNELVLNANAESINAQQKHLGQQLHMVDAEGLWGLKLGDTGLSLSLSKYVPYEECIKLVGDIINLVVDLLEITHFNRVILRNINLFEFVEDGFEDIKEPDIWGSQRFTTFDKESFSCTGASTRHVYRSDDFMSQINITSGVAFKGQTHIPQEDWDMWKLRGGFPANESADPKLIIEIAGLNYQSPVNQPSKQHNVSEYSWDSVKKSFDQLHTTVNNVYNNIAKE